ncbi:MAG: hypothetical protein GEU71_08795 [Actinobacteria bacterium]|nr:hypothetical protein [Actinomycetota bacterium]
MAAALLVALMLLFSACGDPESNPGASGPASPDDPVSSTPDPNESPTGGGAQLVEPQPGQVDVRPIPWTRAKVLDDGAAVKLFWWSGVEPCNVLDRVEVEYTDEAVTMTLFEGHTETDEDVACIEIAVKKATIVELDEPLGDREIVDGADGR